MKTIFIARHAKSSWRNTNLQDIDRPLKSSGVISAERVAERLKDEKQFFDVLYSSPAIRALHTAIIHARTLEFPENRIEIKNTIYNRGKEGLYELIKSINNQFNSVMLCGHDPTFTNFVNDYLDIPLEKIQTSGVVKIELKVDKWSEIRNAPIGGLTYFKREEVKAIKYGKKSRAV